MRVLVLDTDNWREMGIARVLDRAEGITPVLERDLGDQTLSKSLASVVLISEAAVGTRPLHVIKRKFPRAHILVHGEKTDPAAIAGFLTDGADGYFTMSLGEEKLVKAINTVAKGSVWLPEKAVTSIVQQLRSEPDTESLTPSDRHLLQMLADGLTNKEMATRLNVAEITVKTRLARLYRRFGVNTRVQLLSYAMRNGLIAQR